MHFNRVTGKILCDKNLRDVFYTRPWTVNTVTELPQR